MTVCISPNPQIFYYSTMVFQLAGVSNADVATVAVGVVLVIATLISVSYYAISSASQASPSLLSFIPPVSLPPSLSPSLYTSLPPSLPPSQAFLVEVVGRRTLMLYGLGGMAIFFTLLTSMFCLQVCSSSSSSLPPFHICFFINTLRMVSMATYLTL